MKILLTTTISGTRDGIEWPPAGSTIDLPDIEAEAMVAGRLARKVTDDTDTTPTPPADNPADGTDGDPDAAAKPVGRKTTKKA